MRLPLCSCLLLLLLPLNPVGAQTASARKNVQITFLPPPLENASFSLGIYEAKSGKLIRRLHEGATESAFTAGLNGLITKWDGKDDEGKPVVPGRYAARGYGVGPLKVEGVEFLGNDWTDEDDSLRIKHIAAIALVPEDDGLIVAATLADGSNVLLRLAGKDGAPLWKRKLPPLPEGTAGGPLRPYDLLVTDHSVSVVSSQMAEAYQLSDGSPDAPSNHPVESPASTHPLIAPGLVSVGKDQTRWVVAEDTLYQLPAGGDLKSLLAEPDKLAALALRALPSKEGEPLIRAISASANHDRLYLLEEAPGWQRVRGLSWVESKEEEGKKVSEWDTFFERNIRQAVPEHGLSGPGSTKSMLPLPVKLDLVKNPLSPGKKSSVDLTATFDENGSYLVTADGLRLRRISKQPDLRAVKLAQGENAGALTLFQNDGAAWEEFSITGANEMMSFDAGEFEMTANGEKSTETKAAEPPDL